MSRNTTPVTQLKVAVNEVFAREGINLTYEEMKASLGSPLGGTLKYEYFKKLRQKAEKNRKPPVALAPAGPKTIESVGANGEQVAVAAKIAVTDNAALVLDALRTAQEFVRKFGKEGAIEIIRSV